MTFPKRWLDDDGASDAVRDVLRSGRGMDPPDGAEDAVWGALAAKIAVGAAVTAATTATAKTAAAATTTTTATTTAIAGGGLLKSILIGAIGGVIAVTSYSALEPQSAPPKTPSAAIVATAPATDRPASRPESAPSKGPTPAPDQAADAPANNRAPTVQPSSSATSAGSAEAASDAPPAADTSGGSTPAPGSPEERASRLREESDMLNQARTALRGGDTAGTMRLLEEARRKFPGGVLGQEREVLAIEALAKSGARAEASSRAAAFIAAHPSSPHAARLQVFVQ